jgi:hypothetical protein
VAIYARFMPGSGNGGGLLRRWESLPPAAQGGFAFPVLAVVLFLVNLALFNQPLLRSILYGLMEAVPLTALLLVATANERRKRRGAAPDEHTER